MNPFFSTPDKIIDLKEAKELGYLTSEPDYTQARKNKRVIDYNERSFHLKIRGKHILVKRPKQ